MLYKGAAKKLDDIDLPAIGSEIGVGEDPIHALIEVETRGTGFDSQGRVILLFEPHKFYAHLKGEQRAQAVSEHLAYPHWGQAPYPRDSYPRLDKAMEINETAALKSCSWGMGQIMGENYQMLGYDTVQDMVIAFAADEEAQLKGMVAFIKSAGIDDDLRRIQKKIDQGVQVTATDAVPLVRVYNGPGYAKNQYHIRYAAALAKWLKIKDTPWGKDMEIAGLAAGENQAAEAGNLDEWHAKQVQQAERSTEFLNQGEIHEEPKADTSKKEEVEGTPPPQPAQEIKASQPSLQSRLTSLSMPAVPAAVVAAIWKFATNIPPWGWGILGGIILVGLILGAWLYNESMKRANARTLMTGEAAANKDKNNLRLV